MKVLIIENSSHTTGAFRSMSNFCRLLNHKVKFYVAAPAGCWQQLSSFTHFKFNFIEISRSLKTIGYLPMLFWNTIKAVHLLNQNGIRVVHVGDLYNMIGVFIKILKPEIKLIYHVRLLKSSYASPLYKYWINVIKRYADEIICVSECVASEVSHPRKVKVIFDTTDQKDKTRSTKLPPVASLNLVYLGNYIPGKGQDFALQALDFLAKSGTVLTQRLSVQFYGGTLDNTKNEAYLQALKNKCTAYNLNEIVKFNSFESDLSKIFKDAHLLINFSESESFSMVCLEALSFGRPVIATKSGGPQEIIRDEINGLLIENKQPQAMAAALSRIIEHPQLIQVWSEKTLIDFTDKFNPSNLSNKLLDSYRE